MAPLQPKTRPDRDGLTRDTLFPPGPLVGPRRAVRVFRALFQGRDWLDWKVGFDSPSEAASSTFSEVGRFG